MPKSDKPWTHIPDSWIAAVLTVSTTREAFDLVWKHLAECEACRDRYWDAAQAARKRRDEAAMAGMPPGMQGIAIPMGEMPAALKSLVEGLFGSHSVGEAKQMTWDEAMLKMLSHVEQLGDEDLTHDNMEIEGLLMPAGDIDHNEECRQCQGMIKAYLHKLEERKEKMPDKLAVIEKTIAYFKGLLPPEKKKKAKAESKEPAAPSNGEPNSFAM